jgi:sodium-independent sulfate anion transporter 11
MSVFFKIPGRGFVNTWVGVFKNINQIRPCDAAVGFSSIGILLFLRVILFSLK